MDEGSGDGSQNVVQNSSLEKEHSATSMEKSLETVQANLSKLELEKSSHNKKEDNVDADEDDDTASDESDVEPICSYPYGYVKRQTVYICLTCNDPTKENWKPAGICIGCRYACHQGHDLISLETRRNFRCDCGNEKFAEGSLCILCPEKDKTNELNVYNDNYKGTFCTCHCKEADCDAEDPLYQCVVCEDWFHAGHCNANTEGIEKNYTDLICGDCTSKLDFLRYYEPFDPSAVVDDKAISEMMKYSEMNEEEGVGDDPDGKHSCKLTNLKKKDPYPTGQLWTLGWRGRLCRCDNCKAMYKNLNVSFLLDKDDETRLYFSEEDDEEAQEKICTLVRKFEEWLFQMDPAERTEMFQLEPNEVKQKMREYFDKTKKDGDNFVFEDHLLDQLFDSFAEFILDAEGGADYLMDVDALEKVFGESKETKLESANANGTGDASSEHFSSNMV